MLTKAEISDMFDYHSVDEDQIKRMGKIRGAAKTLATLIVTNCPQCDDTSVAIRKVREGVMTANAAITHYKE